MHCKSFFPAVAAALAALVAGCEWTSTSSSDSWSGSYDAMNFAGTYRSAASLTSSSGESTGQSTPASPQSWDASGAHGVFSKTLSLKPIVPGSVTVVISGKGSWKDDGSGNLVGSNGENGTISYDEGTFSVSFSGVCSSGATCTASYAYYPGVTSGSDDSKLSNITAVTVSQSGQNLSMSTNTGLTMSGKFTAVRKTSGSSDETKPSDTYNAQFQVSSSGGYTFTGTLNHDLSSGHCMLNGTIIRGKSAADIQGVGPTFSSSTN